MGSDLKYIRRETEGRLAKVAAWGEGVYTTLATLYTHYHHFLTILSEL